MHFCLSRQSQLGLFWFGWQPSHGCWLDYCATKVFDLAFRKSSSNIWTAIRMGMRSDVNFDEGDHHSHPWVVRKKPKRRWACVHIDN